MGDAEATDEAPRATGGPWLAGLAFALLATSMILPWWAVTNTLETASTTQAVRFGSGAEVANVLATWVTAVLAAASLPLLFIRLAARSWVHEPAKWRRDLGLAGIFVAGALASCWFWPVEGRFWGTRTYPSDGSVLEVVHAPGPGWWVALVATLALGWAWWRLRRAP